MRILGHLSLAIAVGCALFGAGCAHLSEASNPSQEGQDEVASEASQVDPRLAKSIEDCAALLINLGYIRSLNGGGELDALWYGTLAPSESADVNVMVPEGWMIGVEVVGLGDGALAVELLDPVTQLPTPPEDSRHGITRTSSRPGPTTIRVKAGAEFGEPNLVAVVARLRPLIVDELLRQRLIDPEDDEVEMITEEGSPGDLPVWTGVIPARSEVDLEFGFRRSNGIVVIAVAAGDGPISLDYADLRMRHELESVATRIKVTQAWDVKTPRRAWKQVVRMMNHSPSEEQLVSLYVAHDPNIESGGGGGLRYLVRRDITEWAARQIKLIPEVLHDMGYTSNSPGGFISAIGPSTTKVELSAGQVEEYKLDYFAGCQLGVGLVSNNRFKLRLSVLDGFGNQLDIQEVQEGVFEIPALAMGQAVTLRIENPTTETDHFWLFHYFQKYPLLNAFEKLGYRVISPALDREIAEMAEQGFTTALDSAGTPGPVWFGRAPALFGRARSNSARNLHSSSSPHVNSFEVEVPKGVELKLAAVSVTDTEISFEVEDRYGLLVTETDSDSSTATVNIRESGRFVVHLKHMDIKGRAGKLYLAAGLRQLELSTLPVGSNSEVLELARRTLLTLQSFGGVLPFRSSGHVTHQEVATISRNQSLRFEVEGDMTRHQYVLAFSRDGSPISITARNANGDNVGIARDPFHPELGTGNPAIAIYYLGSGHDVEVEVSTLGTEASSRVVAYVVHRVSPIRGRTQLRVNSLAARDETIRRLADLPSRLSSEGYSSAIGPRASPLTALIAQPAGPGATVEATFFVMPESDACIAVEADAHDKVKIAVFTEAGEPLETELTEQGWPIVPAPTARTRFRVVVTNQDEKDQVVWAYLASQTVQDRHRE